MRRRSALPPGGHADVTRPEDIRWRRPFNVCFEREWKSFDHAGPITLTERDAYPSGSAAHYFLDIGVAEDLIGQIQRAVKRAKRSAVGS